MIPIKPTSTQSANRMANHEAAKTPSLGSPRDTRGGRSTAGGATNSMGKIGGWTRAESPSSWAQSRNSGKGSTRGGY